LVVFKGYASIVIMQRALTSNENFLQLIPVELPEDPLKKDNFTLAIPERSTRD